MGRIRPRVCLLAAVLALSSAAAEAQSVESFYRGTSLKMVIGAGPGGGHDAYARVLARYWGAHVPGNPTLVPQNMPGANGLRATNFIYAVAPKDGSVVGLTNGVMTLQPLFTKEGIQFDPLKLNWLGAMQRQNNLCVTWHTSPIKTIQDAQQHEATVSSTGATGARTTVPKLLNAVIGTKFKVITGYETAGQTLAVERGEVDGLCGASYSTLMTSSPAWITEKKVNFLAQLTLVKDPHLPDVPMVIDMVKDADTRNMLSLILTVQEVGRPVIAPPDLLADRLAALQDSFVATMKDPKFLAEANKLQLDISMSDHVAIERLLKVAYAAPKDVVERATPFISAGD